MVQQHRDLVRRRQVKLKCHLLIKCVFANPLLYDERNLRIIIQMSITFLPFDRNLKSRQETII